MKRIIYKSSIIIPLIMIFYSFAKPFAFCIPKIGLYMGTWSSLILIIMVTVVWLCCSPLRYGTCNGTITELLFNIVPVEIVFMLVFAQWHFVLSVLIMLILLGCETALFCALRKSERKHKFSKKQHRRYQFAFRRGSVLSIAVVCAIPCLISIFMYGFKSPIYKATDKIYNQLFSENKASEQADDETENFYTQNTELWGYLQENTWNRLSVQEKITVMQKLVDFEAGVLGTPAIPIKAGMIGFATLGSYDDESNQISISVEHLAKSSVEEVINTICHEVHHSYINYLANSLDWEDPALNTSYFKELRELVNNKKNYKSALKYGFDEYEDQPLEVAARKYGEEETARIMAYIKESGLTPSQ